VRETAFLGVCSRFRPIPIINRDSTDEVADPQGGYAESAGRAVLLRRGQEDSIGGPNVVVGLPS
jgi:hypothetical protein